MLLALLLLHLQGKAAAQYPLLRGRKRGRCCRRTPSSRQQWFASVVIAVGGPVCIGRIFDCRDESQVSVCVVVVVVKERVVRTSGGMEVIFNKPVVMII